MSGTEPLKAPPDINVHAGMGACSLSERYKNSSPTDRDKDKWLRGYLWKGVQSMQLRADPTLQPAEAASAV